MPGDTWPNRLFALAGLEDERAAESLLERLAEDVRHLVPLLKSAPIFDVHAFTRELADEQWRWYSQDPATLRAADSRYRDFTDIKRANFAFFDRQRIDALEKAIGAALVTPDSFLDDAATGRLREVTWIDPNFVDLKVLHPNSDDDHPPSDIRAGQGLPGRLRALRAADATQRAACGRAIGSRLRAARALAAARTSGALAATAAADQAPPPAGGAAPAGPPRPCMTLNALSRWTSTVVPSDFVTVVS